MFVSTSVGSFIIFIHPSVCSNSARVPYKSFLSLLMFHVKYIIYPVNVCVFVCARTFPALLVCYCVSTVLTSGHARALSDSLYSNEQFTSIATVSVVYL